MPWDTSVFIRKLLEAVFLLLIIIKGKKVWDIFSLLKPVMKKRSKIYVQ